MIGYTKDHEYARIDGDVATIGITDFAQSQLGDIVFVDLPPPGKRIEKGKELAVVESVKAASDVFSPLTGDVVEVNAALGGAPSLVNEDPLGQGWLVKLRLSPSAETGELMDEPAYAALVANA